MTQATPNQNDMSYEERAKERKKDEERRDIWTRCQTLLRADSEEQRGTDSSAVLGYN